MQEKITISRALRILGDIRSTLEQRHASELDANCTILAGTALPPILEHKTAEVSQMMGLAVQDGTQQPDIVATLPEPAPFTALETPAGTCHANLHDRPTASSIRTFSEQISAASVSAQTEHPSPQQTPRVGLSAILDTAPDQTRMLTNLPALSSQQAGPSQHGDGLLWMGINMQTADDVTARALAAAAAHPDAAETQHGSGGAFSISSDLSPESEDDSLAHVNRDNPPRIVIEGPTSAPDFGRTPLHRIPSGLTAQLRGKGPLGGHGLRPGTEDDRVGAFWPEAGSDRRVIVQKEFLAEEEDDGDFEDASDKLFGEMSLSSDSHSGTDAASQTGTNGDAPAGMHDVGSSSSSEHVPLTDVGNPGERPTYETAEDTQPSALTNEAAEGVLPSMAADSGATAAELSTDAEQILDSVSTQSGNVTTKVLDMTDQQVTQDARHSEKACTGVGELDTEAVGSATEEFAEQDAAEMEPSGAVQDEDILYELEKAVQQPPSSCTPPASQQRQLELTTPSPDR